MQDESAGALVETVPLKSLEIGEMNEGDDALRTLLQQPRLRKLEYLGLPGSHQLKDPIASIIASK